MCLKSNSSLQNQLGYFNKLVSSIVISKAVDNFHKTAKLIVIRYLIQSVFLHTKFYCTSVKYCRGAAFAISNIFWPFIIIKFTQILIIIGINTAGFVRKVI